MHCDTQHLASLDLAPYEDKVWLMFWPNVPTLYSFLNVHAPRKYPRTLMYPYRPLHVFIIYRDLISPIMFPRFNTYPYVCIAPKYTALQRILTAQRPDRDLAAVQAAPRTGPLGGSHGAWLVQERIKARNRL